MVSDFPLSSSTLGNNLPCLSVSLSRLIISRGWRNFVDCVWEIFCLQCADHGSSLAISFTTSTFFLSWSHYSHALFFFFFFLFGYLLLYPPFLLSGTKTPPIPLKQPSFPHFTFSLSHLIQFTIFLSRSLFFMPLSPSI